MAKTYTAVPSVSTGDVYTASNYNTYTATNVSNLIVPPSCQVRRTTNLTSYSSAAAITWSSSAYDTDGMFTSGSTITVNTAGLYLVTFNGYMTATATLSRVIPAIAKDGVDIAAAEAFGSTTSANWDIGVVVSCAAAATLSAYVTITGGSAYVIVGNASERSDQTRLTATWIGRTS